MNNKFFPQKSKSEVKFSSQLKEKSQKSKGKSEKKEQV